MAAERLKRPVARSLLTILFVLLAMCLAFSAPAWWVLLRPETDKPPGMPVQIEIPAGSNTEEIASILAETGVVPNAMMFRLRTRVAGADGDLRAGIYDLSTGMPFEVVVDTLSEGPPISYVTVVVPEGFTIEQIAARMEKELDIPAAEFGALAKNGADEFGRDYLSGHGGSLEGYLFPKTYRIREGASAHEVIEQMLRQFEVETATLDMSYARDHGFDLHDVVTIASMIEKEAKLDRERPLVASVIYNRLKRKMVLEIDATLEYVLPGHRFRLRNQDLRIESPYNTYKYKGLPPTPIASPGMASIEAAAHPTETGYIYYVLTSTDGAHTFTSTWDEFEKAKRKSKEVFGR
ncbi:MAG: endolytic transglycosylase MltG [Actinobacteria bacterium]|nr:MAG: endolytic transglycosylase MltG [Actinomycetota bacterium]